MTSTVNRRGYGAAPAHKKHAHFSEPKKDKRETKFVTTNVLFKTHPSRIHKRIKPSHDREKSRLGKSILVSHRSPSPPPPPPKQQYTLAAESNAVLNDYRGQVTAAADAILARAYKDLVQRLEHSTLAPNALSIRIAQTVDEVQTLSVPITNHPVPVNYRDANGNVTRSEEIPIGKTVSRFERMLQEKRHELDVLWEEWDEVRQEIAEVGAHILHEPKFPLQFGLEALVNRLSPLAQVDTDVESLRRLIQKESDRAHEELDREAEDSVAAHRRYKAVWIEWLQENAA